MRLEPLDLVKVKDEGREEHVRFLQGFFDLGALGSQVAVAVHGQLQRGKLLADLQTRAFLCLVVQFTECTSRAQRKDSATTRLSYCRLSNEDLQTRAFLCLMVQSTECTCLLGATTRLSYCRLINEDLQTRPFYAW